MDSVDVKQFIERLKGLPTLPAIAIKLIDLSGGDDASLADIAELIKSDQSLSAKVLRIANSTHLGAPGRINTIDQATSWLGLDLVRSLALGLVVFERFESQPSNGFSPFEFWRHSLTCAITSELLARRLGYPRPQEAFIAGLMHDLGKLVLCCWDQKRYGPVIARAQEDRSQLLSVEEKLLGIGHTQVSKLLMESWNFPPSLIIPSWLHHQPLSEFGSPQPERLGFIVKCANLMCHIQHFGDSWSPIADPDVGELERSVGLSKEELRELSAEAMDRFEEVSGHFDFEGSTRDLYYSAVSRANEELAQLNLELAIKNRELTLRQRAMESICRLKEDLAGKVTSVRALQKVLEVMAATLPCERLMGFIPRERERVIEGHIKVQGKCTLRRVSLPLGDHVERDQGGLKAREQIRLIKQAALHLGAQHPEAAEIFALLRSVDLTVLPLDTGNQDTLGVILVEVPRSKEPGSGEKLNLLRQYVRLATLVLEQILLQETLEEQAEKLVQMARKTQEVRQQVQSSERLASVGRLAAGAAHEINNPLSAVISSAELLLRRTVEKRDRQALEVVLQQSDRIAKIVDDLMELSPPAPPKSEITDLIPVMARTLSGLQPRIQTSRVTVKEDYQPTIPRVCVGPKQLEQIFLNLLVNALDAMDKGGVLNLKVGLASDQKRVQIDISDTGTGILPEQLPSIFDPFFTGQKGMRTGLGLSVSRSIIESHQGEITVSSTPGKGTTFSVYLPLTSAQTGSILIVDDEEPAREVLAEALELEGYEIDLAGDGAEGLAKLSERPYALTLLGLRAPTDSRMDILKSMRTTSPHMPVIVVSGIAHGNELEVTRRQGAFACIKKPWNMDELLELIRVAISSSNETEA